MSDSEPTAPGLFCAARAFYLRDDATGINGLVEKGSEVRLADVRVLTELLNMGKIEAADTATEDRLRRQSAVNWEKAPESLLQPIMLSGFAGHR